MRAQDSKNTVYFIYEGKFYRRNINFFSFIKYSLLKSLNYILLFLIVNGRIND